MTINKNDMHNNVTMIETYCKRLWVAVVNTYQRYSRSYVSSINNIHASRTVSTAQTVRDLDIMVAVMIHAPHADNHMKRTL